MIICHISDTHGSKFHSKLTIPPCDVLIHSGDIGGRTNTLELTEFLLWFEKQPAKKKIFIAGNHDLVLDKNWVEQQKLNNVILGMIADQQHSEAINLIKNFNIEYLYNSEYVYEGIKFWGSPYSPSFHRDYWAFNADDDNEIKQYFDLIPKDTDVLIVHSPVYKILDKLLEGDHTGSKVLKRKVDKIKPSLFLCGHIHEDYGNYNDGNTLYVNGSVLNRQYFLTNKPVLIEIDSNKKAKILK